MEDQRGGSRIPLETRITVRYEVGDEERAVELTSRDLDSNAISLAVAVDDPIAKDFHHIFGKKVVVEFPSQEFQSRSRLDAFLYRIERLRSGYARWIFFFNRKINPEEIAEKIRDN
jgi:hypothetical protein